jgi:hypothetical protein
MWWQELAVLVLVAGAALFLFRRFFKPARHRSRPAQTFIPLADVKRRDDQGH